MTIAWNRGLKTPDFLVLGRPSGINSDIDLVIRVHWDTFAISAVMGCLFFRAEVFVVVVVDDFSKYSCPVGKILVTAGQTDAILTKPTFQKECQNTKCAGHSI